jgi:LPS-assembly lipoprotein
MQNLKITFLASLLILLSACGWHLRGQVDLPIALRILDLNAAAADYTTQSALKQALLSNGVTLSSDADYQLKILSERSDKRTLAVTSNAKASEYELIQSLSFVLLDSKEQVVSDEVEIKSFRTQQYDADAAIGKAQEESNMRREMKFDNANKLLLRLKSLKIFQAKTQPINTQGQ